MAPMKRSRRDADDEEIIAVESASSSLRQDAVSAAFPERPSYACIPCFHCVQVATLHFLN